MCRTEQRAVIILLFCLLSAHTPADAWYKQAAGPTYYSVGRASGLLSGIRRSAIRRDERDTRDSGDFTANNEILQTNFALKTLPICVKDVLPELQSCELMQNSMFQCKAAIIITLDSTNCVNT